MRILYITTVGSTMYFFKSLIKRLIEEGNMVDIATNENDSPIPDVYTDMGCKVYPISTTRSPIQAGNISAVKEIRDIVREGKYDIVHCHTPIASMCTRVACRNLRKSGVKVIYTAHGFHFYKGAPLKNWLIFYPIEKICARWTDVLITINKEDYERAKNKFKVGKIEYIPGVGIDVHKFADTVVDVAQKRKSIDIPEDAFLILSVGELNENKNHQVVIKALGKLNDSSIHYAIAGAGDKRDELESLAKGLNVNLHLLGFRSDVAELYKISDVYVLPSFREGLNVSVMEALASGLPVICSNIRGNRDLIDFSPERLCNPSSAEEYAKAICMFREKRINDSERKHIKEKAAEYDFGKINQLVCDVYAGVKV